MLREQEKAEKEMEEAMTKYNKEEKHFNKEIERLQKRLNKETNNKENLLSQIYFHLSKHNMTFIILY